MPHVEIKYSNDLNLDTPKLFDVLESVINEHDSSAGECKSRAYPCSQYKYPHVKIVISLLTKPHRNQEFTEKLSTEIENKIKNEIKQSLYFSLSIEYSSSYYITNVHIVDGEKLLSIKGDIEYEQT